MDELEQATPNWDMTPYSPELRGEAYLAFRRALADDTAAARRWCTTSHPIPLHSES